VTAAPGPSHAAHFVQPTARRERADLTGLGFRLDGGGESLVFLTPGGGAPELAYWGPRLTGDDTVDTLAAIADRAVAPSQLDAGQRLSWMPHAGEGFSGWPALMAHRNGELLITQLRASRVAADNGEAWIDLTDALAGVELRLTLALDADTGVLSSRARLVNLGAPLTLDWLAAGALPSPHAEVMLFDGRWGREFAPVRQSVLTGMLMKENRTGRTSHHAPPFLIIGEAGFGEAHGEVFAVHLAWSGDHRLFAERLRDGRVQVQGGELLHPGEVILARGEAYETPWLHITRSATGLTGLSDRLHPFVRDTILGGRLKARPRLVHYNTWEAVYFDHDPARLRALAELAASVGVERFVLDDGWFAGRANDRAGLGDWRPDRVKYPAGLALLIAHVRGLGMEFGLWVEPEMANADSDLLRAHPDWILGASGRDQPLGRGQYVLDLTRSEVSDTIFAQLHSLLAAHDIGYLKWDMNRELTHAVSAGRAATHRQTLSVYALIDRVRAAHPRVEIESCASGGGRADYEILRRTDRIWTSDTNDPIERQAIQRAFSIFFPPEVMGAHVGPRASHTTARAASLRMRALTALPGHMGVEADLAAMSADERAALAEAIALHKTLRAWLHAGRTVRLEHPDPGMVGLAVVAEDRAFVSAAQIATPATATPAPLRLAGLSRDRDWTVRPLHPPRRPRATLAQTGFLALGEPVTVSGRVLAHAGLPMPILHAGEIIAFLLTREAK